MKKTRILLIDNNKYFLDKWIELLYNDFDCITASNGEKALHAVSTFNPAVILLDTELSTNENGLDVLKHIHQLDASIPVIMVTDKATVEQAVEAIRFGAFNYISKSPCKQELRFQIEQALKHRSKNLMHQSLKEASEVPFYRMIGESALMDEVMEKVVLFAHHHTTVLITGESGVGKEIVARQIHVHSDHKQSPFIAVNCAAIPKELAESELFGHEKGAFTGADKRKLGKFELAGDGVIFLDEISELSPEIQVKLLRILQEKEFNRVGGNVTLKTQAKIIAATNKNLFELVQIGLFREDLFYRLDVLPIHVPALRERKEDIPVLVHHFVDEICKEMKISAKTCSLEAIEYLKQYDWPGNIRQLKNYLTRAIILCHSPQLEPHHFDVSICAAQHHLKEDEKSRKPIPKTWAEMNQLRKIEQVKAGNSVERAFVDNVLAQFEGNITKAAQALGIHRSNLHKLIKRTQKV